MNNLKVIAYLLAFLLTTACSADMTDQQYVESAKSYMDNSNDEAAIITLKNALLQNSNNMEARWLLGNISFEKGDFPSAEKELTLARKLGIDDEAVLPLLAQSLLEQGKNEEVLELQTTGLSNAALAQVLAVQARVLISQNELDEATKKITQARSSQPDSVEALTEEARLTLAKGELEQTRGMLQSILETHPSHALAWSLLGDLESLDKQLEKAETAYDNAIKYRSSNNETDLIKRAQTRISLKKFELAQSDIDRVKQTIPGYFEVNYLQGLIQLHQQQISEALQSFQLSVEQNDGYLPALFYLGMTHYMLRHNQQADTYISRFVSKNPNSIPGRTLLARIRIENGDYAEAEELIRPVLRADEEDVDALTLLAKSLIGQGKNTEGVMLLEKVVSLQPDSADAHLILGAALVAAGDRDAGVEQLKMSISLDPQSDKGYLLLIQNYLQQKELDQALEIAETYLDQYPDTTKAYRTLGAVRMAREEHADAEKAFTRAMQLTPGDPSTGSNLAAIAINAEDYDKAQGYYEEVLKYHENHLQTLLKLVALDERRQDRPGMMKHINLAIEAHPEAIQPRILLARLYLVEGKPDQVMVALGELSPKQRDIPDVLGLIALAQLNQQQYSDARISLERLVELTPDQAKAHYLLARAFAGQKNRGQVKVELEKTLALDPGHISARIALARLFLTEGQLDKSREQLEMVKEIAPDNPSVLRIEASLASHEGNQEQALEIYTDLFAESESSASMLELAQQTWSMGDQDDSLAIQESWVAEHQEDIATKITLANAYVLDGRTNEAVALYQQILEEDENNLIALNNLAWHLRDSSPKQALEYATRASKLAPESAAMADTLAVILLKNGELERALRKIDRALAYSPNNPTIRYHSAMIREAAGYKAESIETLTTLLKEDRDFPEKAEASRLLERLQSGG